MTAARLFWTRLFLGAVLLIASAAPSRAAEDNAIVAEALRALFHSGKADTGSLAANAALPSVREIYEIRDFKPIWTRDNGPKAKAKALLAELKISAVHGLSPEFYHVAEIEALMGSKNPAELARLDMLLSGAIAEFGEDLTNGRIGPAIAGSENAVEPVAVSPSDMIAGAEAAEHLRDFAGALLTADFRYVRLIAKLAEFSRIQASGQWPEIDANGSEIMPGGSDPRLKDIRTLLALSGDLPFAAVGRGDVHDETSIQAVRSFQTRHGLDPSGAIDQATLAEMSVPIEDRIRQIKINLERRRWQNRDLGKDYISVNLADSSVKLVHDEKSVQFVTVTNVEQLRELPTFFGRITGVEGRPTDTSRIVLTVDSPFIQQLRGEASEKTIAITDAEALAGELLASHAAPGAMIDDLLASDALQRIDFAEPLPLFVTFVTAWANRDGSVHFRPDMHGRDRKLAELLQLD
jgi:murein L,D-transpeptidase YcbB/YkuD